jgi:hypothetical protein
MFILRSRRSTKNTESCLTFHQVLKAIATVLKVVKLIGDVPSGGKSNCHCARS